MGRLKVALLSFLLGVMPVGTGANASAQAAPASDSCIAKWQARATATQNEQPHWATPLTTSTPRIDQALRMEFTRDTKAGRYNTWNYGNNKGLELIPAARIQVTVGVPPFFSHSQPGAKDGFGDVWFQGKYRIFSRNEEHGNAVVTAIMNATVPTGKNGNGVCCAVVTPTLGAGKGFGRMALISTLAGSLPVTNAHGLGRSILWNNVAEYRVGPSGFARLLVPEMEFNSTFYHGGPNDGKIQTLATIGMLVGRIPMSHDASGKPGRRALTLGAGEQIALTHFHTYNHGLVLTLRVPF